MKTQESKLCAKIYSVFGEKSKVENLNLKLGNKNLSIFYIESLIDKKLISNGVLLPLQKRIKDNAKQSKNAENPTLNALIEEVFPISSIESVEKEDDVITGILDGKVAVVFHEEAILIPVFGAEKRGIEEPPTSRVVKGPREGFVEDIATNVGLIRKRLKTTNLQIEDMVVGKQTNSKVMLFYLDGIARPDIVETVKKKIKSINILNMNVLKEKSGASLVAQW